MTKLKLRELRNLPKEKELGSSGIGTLFNIVWEERTKERETIDKKRSYHDSVAT